MKQLSRLILASLIAIGSISGTSGIADPKPAVPLPTPVCERSHEYALELLSTDPVNAIPDTQYSIDPKRYDSLGFYPKSDPSKYLATGRYSALVSKQGLTPRFLMGVDNQSGRLFTGLCWWHSRFQRAAAYLVDFAPNAPAPTSKEAKKILRKITNFQPVTLPGYDSLPAFTYAFRNELETVLTEWELRTTALAPGHMYGSSLSDIFMSKAQMKDSAKKALRALIDDFDVLPRPEFLMLDLKGELGLHAFLILGYRVEDSGDIVLTYLNSNVSSHSSEWRVLSNGKLNLDFPHYGTTGEPALGSFNLFRMDFDSDFKRIQDGLRTKCGQKYTIRQGHKYPSYFKDLK